MRSTQPLKISTRDLSWGKGGRCVWLTTYRPCSAESREDPGLNLPGTPRATSACCGRPLLYFCTVGFITKKFVPMQHGHTNETCKSSSQPQVTTSIKVVGWFFWGENSIIMKKSKFVSKFKQNGRENLII